MLMGERVFPRGIEDKHRSLADHGGNVVVMHRVNLFAGAPQTGAAEIDGLGRGDDSVNVAPLGGKVGA